jgi:uncharacterized protein YggE
MSLINLASFMAVLMVTGLSGGPVWGAETPSPPSIRVSADGKVMATPDLARLTLEIETQAATAAGAAQENAQRAAKALAAVKKVLGPEDKLRTLGYSLTPVRAYRSKSSPPEIKAYRAVNRWEVKVMEVGRLGVVMDTAMKNGVSQVKGPFWGHSHQEELQEQAAVNALKRARSLAAALAQAGGVKITGVRHISTGIRFIAPRGAGEFYAVAKSAAPTPIEVGQEEIRANVQVEFAISP